MFPVSFISDGLAQNMALAHYNRVVAAGGVLPAGVSGLTSILNSVISVYGITSSSDFNTKVPVFLDPHYTGYKLGAGSGTTLGQAAQTVFAINSAADTTQATAASQPLLLNYSGVNYWWNGGVNANYCSTPNAAANQITGDIDIIAYISNYANNGASLYVIASKGDTLAYVFDISSTNFLELYTGGTSYNSGVSIGATYTGWVRCTRVASSGLLKFYTSTNSQTTNPQSVIWTQSGSNISTVAGNLGSNTNPLAIGGHTATGLYTMNGKIYRATIANSIDGAPVVDFNPSSYRAATSQTSWVSTTGETWTINTGTALTGYKGLLVDRTLTQGDGIDDGMQTASSITLNTVFTMYGAFKGYQNEGGSGKVTFGKINIDGAFSRYAALTLGAWFGNGGSAVMQTSSTVTNLNMLTLKRKVSDNTLQVNNGTIVNDTSATTITNSAIGIFTFTPSNFSNSLFATGFVSSLEDNTTQKTAMYNIIRSINNNAF